MKMGWVAAGAGAAAVGAVAAGAVLLQPQTPPTPQQILKDLTRHAANPLATTIAAAIMTGSGVGAPMDFSKSDRFEASETTDLPAEGDKPAGTRTETYRSSVEVSGQTATYTRERRVSDVRGAERENMRVLSVAKVGLCPDANGKVSLDISVEGSVDNALSGAAGTGGASVNLSGKGRAEATVNDDAFVTGMRLEASGAQSMRGGSNLAAGGATAAPRFAGSGAFTIRSENRIDAVNDQTGKPMLTYEDGGGRSIDLSGEDTSELSRTLARAIARTLDDTAKEAFQGAQAQWRSGYCTEIVVKPPNKGGGETNVTTAGEVRPVPLAVRHKFDGSEISARMAVKFTGKETVAPESLDETPGSLTFTAGKAPDDTATLNLTATSRRGVATDQVRFSNACYRVQLSVGPYFVIDDKVCDIENPFSLNPRGEFGGVTVRFTPNGRNGGTFSQSGKAYGVSWSGGGPYTIAWENGVGRFTGQDNNVATAPVGRSENNDVMTGTFTPAKN